MSPTLSDLKTLAYQAGEILRNGFNRRPGYGTPIQVSHKGVIDLVTEIDHRSEAFLLSEIQGRFPTHQIMTEESGFHKGSSAEQWIIDPLDGSVNYAHGLPLFTVSIAFAQNGMVQLGVVYDPMQDECFSTERGGGAHLNDEPIHVSLVSDLNNSLLVSGFPYDIRTNPENNLDNYVQFSLVSQAVRRLGSAALDLAYVATGRIDGFWEIRLSAWDIAAGGLIVQEAGGTVTNIYGGSDFISAPQSILAANPMIHPLMLEILNRKRE
jgi:myo-inositol-1(or 4)-monophosphatase